MLLTVHASHASHVYNTLHFGIKIQQRGSRCYFENSAFGIIMSWSGRVIILLVISGSDWVGSEIWRMGRVTKNGHIDISDGSSRETVRMGPVVVAIG